MLKKIDFSNTPDDLSEQDLVIWGILKFAGGADDEEDDQNTISSYEFINNYKKYQSSFNKFKITGE